MSFKPSVETKEQRSQATPLATDILAMIQGQMDQGTFGQGFGPLQTQAGSAIQQYLNSGAGTKTPGVRDVNMTPGANFASMVQALEQVQNRRVSQQAGDLREQAGAAGTRYGSTLGTAEGRFRGAAQDDFNVQLGQLIMALDEARRADTQLGVSRDVAAGQLQLGGQDQFLNAISQMFNMGTQSMAPAFNLAGMGILPEHLITSPGIGSQLLSGGMNLAAGMLPVAGKYLLNRGQNQGQQPGGGGGGFTMPSWNPSITLPEYRPRFMAR